MDYKPFFDNIVKMLRILNHPLLVTSLTYIGCEMMFFMSLVSEANVADWYKRDENILYNILGYKKHGPNRRQQE